MFYQENNMGGGLVTESYYSGGATIAMLVLGMRIASKTP